MATNVFFLRLKRREPINEECKKKRKEKNDKRRIQDR